MTHKRFAAITSKLGLAVAIVAAPLPAVASDFSFKLEPGVTLPLSSPQSQIYGVGGGQTLKALFGISRYLDVGPSASFTMLPARAAGEESGVAWTFGGGLRLKRPHDATTGFGLSPWVDADLLYVRTGELNRAGFDAAVGLSVPMGASRTFWVGPFIRYLHIFQGNRPGYDNSDAKMLTLGISFEVGSGIRRAVEVISDVRTVTQEGVCPDNDNDGAVDSADRCPYVAGALDNWGCPNYKKLVVKKDKLELKEKLYFAFDEAKLEVASFPVLDEVVLALIENRNFRVQVEGHTDSTGGDGHNQTLSERRAEAVLDYLVTHGVSKDRLVSKGFASTAPIATNVTEAGRDANRRVEFVVSFIILGEQPTR